VTFVSQVQKGQATPETADILHSMKFSNVIDIVSGILHSVLHLVDASHALPLLRGQGDH